MTLMLAKISVAKTKTEAIITNVISPFCLETIKDQIDKVSYVGVLTDSMTKALLTKAPPTKAPSTKAQWTKA